MVMWVLLALYALNRWRETPTWRWAAEAGLLGGMAVLVKVFAAFFIGGIFTALLLSQALGSQGQLRRLWRSPQVWVMGALVVIPAAVYYLFILQDRSSGFFSFWTLRLGKLIFTSGFYADWLAMVSGLVGLALFAAALVGVCLAPGGLRALLVGFWVGYFLFGLFSPYQYTTHEYYHLGLVPMAALSCLPVVEALRERLLAQARLWRGLALGVLVFFAAYNLWVARSVLYAANFRPEATAWRKVGEALPENHSFIALTADYGMRLRYFGWRSPSAFWPSTADQNLSVLSGNQPLQYAAAFEKMTAGQDYFLVTAFTELDAQPELKQLLTTRYALFKDGDGFVIYDLKSPITP
jgi:4-amino-4-deoxy-L-arabinose transferase-like glycosyltransferase